MSNLHDALEVMDKATEPLRGEEQFLARKVVEKAAPDALAWIKEALPWLEEMRLHVSIDPAHYDHELASLDALIAQAKPEV